MLQNSDDDLMYMHLCDHDIVHFVDGVDDHGVDNLLNLKCVVRVKHDKIYEYGGICLETCICG